jgi:hypothetical protein
MRPPYRAYDRLLALASAVILTLAACSPATTETGGLGLSGPDPSATSPAGLSALGLPTAQNAAPLAEGAVPVVSVLGSSVTVDGVVVGDASVIVTSGRLQRIDGLFESLKAKRATWKAANAGKPFPGVVLLGFEKVAPAVLVKSVFQTAAFAGFPNAGFAVRGTSGAVGRLDVDAIVPAPPPAPPPPSSRLIVSVAHGKLTLVWHKEGAVVATTDVASIADPKLFDLLAGRLEKEWPRYATHTGSTDQAIDQAILDVPDDFDYAHLIAIVDTIQGVRRELDLGGLVGKVSALNVSLSVAKEPVADPDPPAAHPSNRVEGTRTGHGTLPPEVIQRVVRQNFRRFEVCYDKGLARNGALAGRFAAKFVIAQDGTVKDVFEADGPSFPDSEVVACLVSEFARLVFPRPEGGVVTVVYPINFKQDDDSPTKPTRGGIGQ